MGRDHCICQYVCASVRISHEQGLLRLQLASAHTHTHARTDSGAYRLDSAEGVDVSSCDGGHGCSQSLCQLCDLSIVKRPVNSVPIQFRCPATSV